MFSQDSAKTLVSDERQTVATFLPKEQLLARLTNATTTTSSSSKRNSSSSSSFSEESITDAVRFLLHSGVSQQEFSRVQWLCEDYCQTEINRAKKQEVKRSFVRLLGARDPNLVSNEEKEKENSSPSVGATDGTFGSVVSAAFIKQNSDHHHHHHYNNKHNKTETVFVQTEEQEKEEKIINFFKFIEVPRLVLTALLQFYLLLAVPIRFGFDWQRPVYVIVIEALICDLPLLTNLFLHVFVAPVTQHGLERFPPLADRFKELFVKDIISWLTLFGCLPLEIVGAVFQGSSTIKSSYYDGLYENFDTVESPVWHANRIIHGILFIPSLVIICDLILFRMAWNPEITRLVQTFAQLLFASHLFACVGIKWRPTEPSWLMTHYNTSSISAAAGGATGGINFNSISKTEALHIYITKNEWMLKQMVTMGEGPIIFDDRFRSFLTVAIVIIGLVLSALIIAVISAFVERDTAHTQLGKMIDTVLDAGEHMRLPSVFTRQIIEDVSHRSVATTHMMQPLDVFHRVPPSLQRQLLQFQGKQVVSHVPLFQPCLAAPQLLVEIAKNLKPMVLPPLQLLFKKGDPGNALYFVVDGWLAVLKEDDDDEQKNNLHHNHQNNNNDQNDEGSGGGEYYDGLRTNESSAFALDMMSASSSGVYLSSSGNVLSSASSKDDDEDSSSSSSNNGDSDDDNDDEDRDQGWKKPDHHHHHNKKKRKNEYESTWCSCIKTSETQWQRRERLEKKLRAFDEAQERYKLGPGHVIGEISVIAHSPRTATVRARRHQFVHLLVLSRDVLDVQQTRFPKIFASIRYAAKVRYLDMISSKQQQLVMSSSPQQQQQRRKIPTKVQYVRSGPRSRE